MTIGSFLEKNRINEFVEKYNMLEEGDGVVLGLSGGPDSVCLFFVLLALQNRFKFHLTAVHINHMIRGKDADEDQSFVENLCKEFKIDCLAKRIDIPKLAKKSGRPVEEEARLARYELFDEVADELEAKGLCKKAKIAIAHNANDNAETVLFHMARGCGLDGVCGIAPTRDRIIRPLLKVKKADILAFLNEEGIDYCIDGTNSDVDYDRNRIRHNVMPELEEVNSRALEHMSTMTEHLQEVALFLDTQADGLLLMAKAEDGAIRKKTLLTAPKVIRAAALKKYLSQFMPLKKDVSESHIEMALSLLDSEGEKYVDLPHGKKLVISYENIYVVDQVVEETELDLSKFEIRDFPYEMGLDYPRNTYTKWFDYDKITGDIEIRTRQEGDYLTVNSTGGRKLIKDYFIDSKVPKSNRDNIPLICDGSHVLWVVGYRISEFYKITDDTKRVLEIRYMED